MLIDQDSSLDPSFAIVEEDDEDKDKGECRGFCVFGKKICTMAMMGCLLQMRLPCSSNQFELLCKKKIALTLPTTQTPMDFPGLK